MRTRTWSKFIGIICTVVGAYGIYSSSASLSMTTYPELLAELSSEIPSHIITWRYGLRYLGLLVNIVYFISGIYFLWRRSFSLRLIYAALILSLLHIVVPMIFLHQYKDYHTFYRYGLEGFNFIRPMIDLGLLAGVVMVSKRYYDEPDEFEGKSKRKSNYRLAIILVSGAVMELLIELFPMLIPMSCLLQTLIGGIVYLIASLAMGFHWPAYSWKNGLLLVAPSFLFFFPFGLLNMWFAAGWDFAFGVFTSCGIYYLVAVLIASCAGGYIGALWQRQLLRNPR